MGAAAGQPGADRPVQGVGVDPLEQAAHRGLGGAGPARGPGDEAAGLKGLGPELSGAGLGGGDTLAPWGGIVRSKLRGFHSAK